MTEFLFGEYGSFDALAHRATYALKARYPNIKTVYVQAYYKPLEENMKYKRNHYDETLYPAIEDKPPKFAITYRNRAMVDSSDFCIFYVRREHGGAFDTMRYAKRKNKVILNLTAIPD